MFSSKGIGKPLQWLVNNTDPFTKWLQVFALVVAAYWTYTRFLVGDKPSLETRVDITSHLRWETGRPKIDPCYVYFDIDLRNEGRASFDVRKTRIRAWHQKFPMLPALEPQFIDLDRLQMSNTIIDLNNTGLLNMHFAPGEKTRRDFAWTFPRQQPGLSLFRVDLDAVRDGQITHISSRSWSQYLCATDGKMEILQTP